ncbi:MAG: 16S rRNA (guanine(966)-N(2))-methyltransferase RsmD, partial [Firmicutes bacterium]|nr:16S rRNA (guanine(966)-N(2))-methyltransferase RsmD [Bacillota bacterium]
VCYPAGGSDVRIITGSARGLKHTAPKALNTRPTTDRIKENLFNILAPDIPESRFLDIFCGSGAIAAEALSRGAAEAFLIDSSSESIEVSEKNIRAARLEKRARIIKSDAVSALFALAREGRSFDIIFMDPPYKKGLIPPCLKALLKGGLIAPEGLIVAEHGADDGFEVPTGLKIYREKEYKTTVLTFLCLEDK